MILEEEVNQMSNIVNVNFEKREETGKQAAKKTRKSGYTPSVFYGPDYPDGVMIKVKTDEIEKYVYSGHWETTRVEASLPDGTKSLCLMRNIQKDFLTDEILHIDFLQMVKGHKIYVNVPITPLNKESCVGVKAGGVFEQVLHEIGMQILPMEIPESVDIDVQHLEIGDYIYVSDLVVPESAELDSEPDEVVFSLSHVKVVEEPEEGLEGEELEEMEEEVEVIGKGKSDEEEGEEKE